MNTRDKARLKNLIIDTVVALGQGVSEKADFYSWADYSPKSKNKIKKIGIDYDKTDIPEDASWAQFQGTFADSQTAYGIEVNLVLLDGSKMVVRYEGSFSEILNELLSNDD